MNVQTWLKTATVFLQSKRITTARLDALVLLEDVMNVRREQLLAEPTTAMTDAQVAHLQQLLVRRSRHEPLSYIRGKTEFYGRNFVLNKSVLEPRSESEAMIELLKSLYPERLQDSFTDPKDLTVLNIADVGAGSGALGITAALELKNSRVELLEIDTEALKVAQRNVDLQTTAISVIASDLLSGSGTDYAVLLCNLPYVPDDYQINQAATHEPKIAIFGGSDGLDLYRKLFEQAQNRSTRPLFILTESLTFQHGALSTIARDSGYMLQESEDLIQLFRLQN